MDFSPLKPVSSSEDVLGAVRRARDAQVFWREQPFQARVQALRKAASAMLRNRNEIIRLVRDEMGKCTADALFTEVLGPLETLNGWVDVVKVAATGEPIRLNPLGFPGKKARLRLVPRGVVGVIAPWNFPVAGLYRSVFPALLLGNGIVVKPSEHTPESSNWFVAHLAAQLPPDLIASVFGGPDTGRTLVESGIDACCFTGSVGAGRDVQRRCAALEIPCSAELGGNDVAIVLNDCDVPRTVAGMTQWSLQNNGQACGAIEVAAVEAGVADSVAARLSEAFRKLARGSLEMQSPLAHQAQLDTVDAHVRDALDKGAQLLCGGRRAGDGLFYLPTLLDHCREDMRVVSEETFGPVLALVRVPHAHEATQMVNRGRFGLTASVWSQDIERAERIADRLEVGSVTINNHAMTSAIPQLAWSGWRDSGLGIANSRWALTTFARPKSILVDTNSGPDPFWLPYDGQLIELGHRLAEIQLGQLLRSYRIPGLLRGRRERIKAFFHMT